MKLTNTTDLKLFMRYTKVGVDTDMKGLCHTCHSSNVEIIFNEDTDYEPVCRDGCGRLK